VKNDEVNRSIAGRSGGGWVTVEICERMPEEFDGRKKNAEQRRAEI
jgi:hypothetical protein